MGRPSRRPTFPPSLLSCVFLISGFSSLILEVTWARQLTQLTGSGVRATASVAAVTLAGLALGAWLGGWRCDRLVAPLRAYAWVEMSIGVWALLTPVLCAWAMRLTPRVQAFSSGSVESAAGPLLASILLVLPGSLLMGATTPLMVRADFSLAGSRREDESAGLRLGRLYGWNTLGGAAGAMVLQWWVSVKAYPLVISGKPLFSWQAFVPVMFELGVMGGVLGAVFGMLAFNGLPMWSHPLFNSARFERVTTDGFFISIESRDPRFHKEQSQDFLRRIGAREVEVIQRASGVTAS